MTTRFLSTAAPEGERVRLIRDRPARLLAKAIEEVIAFEDWPAALGPGAGPAYARLLQAVEDGEGASIEADAVLVTPALAAQLSEPMARVLGLPPATKLQLDLRSAGLITKAGFRVEARWVRAGRVPVQARATGARLRHDARDHRLPEPFFSTLAAVERINAATEPAEAQAQLAALRTAMGEEAGGRIGVDGVIERLRVAYAAGFSLQLRAGAGGFDFDPVLFGRERLAEAGEEGDAPSLDETADGLLPPAQAADFARRFRMSAGARRSYLLDDGAILFVDPALAPALAVVREAQAAGPDARRAFARNPRRALAEALHEHDAATLFVETEQFSERVAGIDVWRKPVLPWIKPTPNGWLPERFGLRLGNPPDDRLIEIAPERVDEAYDLAEHAVREARAEFSWDGAPVPATHQALSALADLKTLVAAAAPATGVETRTEDAPAALRGRYFLQVRDNLEEVAFAPLLAKAVAVAAPPPELPPALRSRPKPHQVDGFAWLVAHWRSGTPGALLADDMGLGKTFQALAFLAWARQQESQPQPVLIIAPTGLLANWRAEIERHLEPGALGPVVGAHGAGLARMRDGAGRDIDLGESRVDPAVWAQAGVVLTTYETMRDYHLSFARQRFAAIIYDEAQKLKNPASQTTRAAKTLNARFQLAMTGTPVENRLQDLWSIYDVVHPGLLGSSKAFETEYPSASPDRLRALHALLAEPQGGRPPLLLRRMKDECLLGLPAKHVLPLPMPMPRRQAAAYADVVSRALAAKGTGEPGRMLEALHRLRGVSLHPIAPESAADEVDYWSDGARLVELFRVLGEIAGKREKVLIFCETLAMQALLAAEIRRRFALPHPVPRIHGGVAGDARQAEVDAFQRRGPGFDAMILSPKAGGVGLTLTAANHVVHLSRWWNPAVEDQATDRAYRIGQERDVYVYLPQAVHPDPAVGPMSFDLKLHALMERKRSLSRGLLAPGEDESDTAALFDAVVQERVADAPSSAPVAPEPEPVAAPAPGPKRILSLRLRPRTEPIPAPPPPPAAVPDWPRRIVYEPGGARDYAIFQRPVAGERIATVTLRDPYACAGDGGRRAVVDFVVLLNAAAQSIDAVRLICLDAEGAPVRDLWEPDDLRRDDLFRRWAQRLGERPALHLETVSRRQNRAFHDREVVARMADGRTLIWDLGRGLDGVMQARKECRVTLTVETV
jgi:hypothetical protein